MGKTERTRTALLAAALELFEERGYEETTAAAIAQRVGVTEMTFYRHFSSKDTVLVADPYDPLIAEAVAAQPADLGALAAVAAGIRSAWGSVPAPETAAVRERLRIVSRTPSLRGLLARNSGETEEAIAGALIARGGSATASRIAAAASLGALNASLLAWADADDDADLGGAIEAALRVLEGRHD